MCAAYDGLAVTIRLPHLIPGNHQRHGRDPEAGRRHTRDGVEHDQCQHGGGACRLAGGNSYSGITTIAGGTLVLAGTGSIGTGGLNLGTAASPGTFDLATLTAGTYALPATGNLVGLACGGVSLVRWRRPRA